MSAIQDAADGLAVSVAACMDLIKEAGIEATLDKVAELVIERGKRAVARVGSWSAETTSEEIEEAVFAASVAQDAIDGTFRPSVGSVREYVIKSIRTILPE